MRYIDEYRDKEKVRTLAELIKKTSKKEVAFMEVCGGHTMAIQKFGIPSLLPDNVRLISGPGCPVCVTGRNYIDRAVAYSRLPDVIITTYGDLIRVPGSTSSLDNEKARGADIRIVYSILDALSIARDNPAKKVVFLGIGFEQLSPGVAASLGLEEDTKGVIILSVVEDSAAADMGFPVPFHGPQRHLLQHAQDSYRDMERRNTGPRQSRAGQGTLPRRKRRQNRSLRFPGHDRSHLSGREPVGF